MRGEERREGERSIAVLELGEKVGEARVLGGWTKLKLSVLGLFVEKSRKMRSKLKRLVYMTGRTIRMFEYCA